VLFGSEELHPAAVSTTSTARTSRPVVVRPIASHPLSRQASISGGLEPLKSRPWRSAGRFRWRLHRTCRTGRPGWSLVAEDRGTGGFSSRFFARPHA
jgi:hypothetical protein